MRPEIKTVTEGREQYYRLMNLTTYRKRMTRNVAAYTIIFVLSMFLLLEAITFTFAAPYDFPAFWQYMVMILFWPISIGALIYSFWGLNHTINNRQLIYAGDYEPIASLAFVADTPDSFAHFEFIHEERRVLMPVSYLLSVIEKDNHYFLKYDCVGLLPWELRKDLRLPKAGYFRYKWFLFGVMGIDADFWMVRKEDAERDPVFHTFLQNYL